jgi:hypothetical protein
MSSIKITVSVEIDGVSAPNFPWTRRFDFAQAQILETVKPGGDVPGTFFPVPGVNIGDPLQAVVISPDQPVSFMFAGDAPGDGIINVNPGGLLIAFGVNEDTDGNHAIIISNPGVVGANLRGLVAGGLTATAGTPSAPQPGFQGFAYGPPTTGTWIVGDYFKNLNPTPGSPIGWVCTVGGTPGTWNSDGIVGDDPGQ